VVSAVKHYLQGKPLNHVCLTGKVRRMAFIGEKDSKPGAGRFIPVIVPYQFPKETPQIRR
jgi:hypothetical protein